MIRKVEMFEYNGRIFNSFKDAEREKFKDTIESFLINRSDFFVREDSYFNSTVQWTEIIRAIYIHKNEFSAIIEQFTSKE